ncbi:hypothetical protein DFAR_2460011 [Desulfarculales bacterium]
MSGEPRLSPGRAAILALLLALTVLAFTHQVLIPYNATPEQRYFLLSSD